MTKKMWIDVIRRHVQPVAQEDETKLYEIPSKNGKKGFIEVLVGSSEHINYSEKKNGGFIGSAVEIDSEDFLVLHFDETWSSGSKMTVSYVLWRDIRYVKFFWPED